MMPSLHILTVACIDAHPFTKIEATQKSSRLKMQIKFIMNRWLANLRKFECHFSRQKLYYKKVCVTYPLQKIYITTIVEGFLLLLFLLLVVFFNVVRCVDISLLSLFLLFILLNARIKAFPNIECPSIVPKIEASESFLFGAVCFCLCFCLARTKCTA